MNEHVTNETPTEIAGDAGVLAEMAALRHRLAALEARLPGNAPEQQAKRRTSTKTVAWLTTGAVLAMLAGASLVYGQSAVDALFISKEGNVGVGTSTPLATAKLQVAGAGGGWFSPDATSGAGVRVWQDGATGSVFSYDYKAGGPRNLVLQQPGGNVGIGTATPQADNKLEVNGKIAATSLNVDSATMKSLTALGALTVEKDTTVKGPMKIEGNNVLEFGAPEDQVLGRRGRDIRRKLERVRSRRREHEGRLPKGRRGADNLRETPLALSHEPDGREICRRIENDSEGYSDKAVRHAGWLRSSTGNDPVG
jgi:hypothetical protein